MRTDIVIGSLAAARELEVLRYIKKHEYVILCADEITDAHTDLVEYGMLKEECGYFAVWEATQYTLTEKGNQILEEQA